MSVPERFRNEVAAFPPALRALLEAELAAGNEIAEIGHSFPAPPVGAYVKLTRSVTTRPRASGSDIDFYDRNSSIYSGEFADSKRFFFILEPPHPPQPESDMEGIRSGRLLVTLPATRATPVAEAPPTQAGPVRVGPTAAPETPLERFKRSMIIDYEKWHDGIGYDLEALSSAAGRELAAIETLLVNRGARDWRDVEALAALGTPRAREVLKAAISGHDHEVRAAAIEQAPGLMSDPERTASTVNALANADLYCGLSETLDQIPEFHPPEVVEALFRGALGREGEIAVHCAAMLMFLHGQAPEPFDWEQRPFFLKFHTEDRAERAAAFRELCEKIGIDATTYLRHGPSEVS